MSESDNQDLDRWENEGGRSSMSILTRPKVEVGFDQEHMLANIDTFKLEHGVNRYIFSIVVLKVRSILINLDRSRSYTFKDFVKIFEGCSEEVASSIPLQDPYLPKYLVHLLKRYFKGFLLNYFTDKGQVAIGHISFDFTHLPLEKFTTQDLEPFLEILPSLIGEYNVLDILTVIVNTTASDINTTLGELSKIGDLEENTDPAQLGLKVAKGVCAVRSINIINALEKSFPNLSVSHIRFEGIQGDYIMRAQHSILGIVFPDHRVPGKERVLIVDPTIAQLGLTDSAVDSEGNFLDIFDQSGNDIEFTICDFKEYDEYIRLRYSVASSGLTSGVENPYSQERIRKKIKFR